MMALPYLLFILHPTILLLTPHDLFHFTTIIKKYGYWNATPEENKMIAQVRIFNSNIQHIQ
jgi:hypothetical protein